MIAIQIRLIYKALNREISKSLEERDKLTAQLEEYCAKLIRTEDIVKTKEQERKDLLITYKNLVTKHSELALETQQRDIEKMRFASFRLTINRFRTKESEKDAQIQKLMTILDELEQENHKYVIELRQFESQTKGRRNLILH